MIWDFLYRRRCDGKLMSEISLAYSVKLMSNPFHVLVCLSLACVIRAPHCVNTRDFQVDAIKDTFSYWKIITRQREVINIRQAQRLNDTVFVSGSPQAKFNERFFASHVWKIGGNTLLPSSWSVDQTVHGPQQANTLVMLRFAEHVGNSGCAVGTL